MSSQVTRFWSESIDDLMVQLHSRYEGLTAAEALELLAKFGPNRLKPKKKTDSLTLLISQFKNPIIIILLFSSFLAFLTSDSLDGLIIILIVLLSSILGFWQERMATNAVEDLLSLVKVNSTVIREGNQIEIPLEYVVPGDIVFLSAGNLVPGDCRLLESNDVFVNESTLTGETFPVEKNISTLEEDTPLSKRTNSLFMGTSIASGTATAIIVRTGTKTEFGQISQRLRLKPPLTEFERGINRFGYLLMQVTLLFILAIFAFNVYFARSVVDSFLFALALAIGITPQMLPAIISVNLSHGAKEMAKNKVIVKRLAAIENFGSMNILCSDKTGTITEGRIFLHSALDSQGIESEKTLFYAYLNASFQSGYKNPIDESIVHHHTFDLTDCSKVDEIPYDFVRKRLSIVVFKNGTNLMITKGAVQNILEICSNVEPYNDGYLNIDDIREQLLEKYTELSKEGFRTLAICYKDMGVTGIISKDSESMMTFLGFLVFHDPPKGRIAELINKFRQIGVSFKMVTGDNKHVAESIGRSIGIADPVVLAGPQIRQMSDEALYNMALTVDIFAEIEPNQKERIILALKKSGNVVGYMGDGINDVSALHAADVSISVDSAIDVAKQTAEIVLLEKDLSVLLKGVETGRKTFANTIKYIFITLSANFGNMFSMAGASLLLPFLPLLPKQILTINILTDFPATTIATDNVDTELLERPRRWNIKFMAQFMTTFGLTSTIFDFITFGILILVLNATPDQFRTGWFIVSIMSELLVMLIIRTQRVFLSSRPSAHLAGSSLVVLLVAFMLPYTPLAIVLDLVALPLLILTSLFGVVILYILTNELTKRFFYKRTQF